MDTLPERPGKGQWEKLCSFLNYWNYKPDTDVLKVVLATALSHYDLDAKPIFLMIIGPSSGGKSSIMLRALDFLPQSKTYNSPDTITSKAFISGTAKGMLFKFPRIDGVKNRTHGIIGLSDYSTIHGMNPLERRELESQFRVIYDQRFSRQIGIETKHNLAWSGKITFIGACTAVFDDMYDTQSELGQRMVVIRMPMLTKTNGVDYASKSAMQVGHEVEITAEFRGRIKKLLDGLDDGKFGHITVPPEITKRIEGLAEFTAKLRSHVAKTENGEVKRKPTEETGARLTKVFMNIALGLAKLARRDTVTEADCKLVERIARDSVPQERLTVLEHLPLDADGHGDVIGLKDFKDNIDAVDVLVPYQFRCAITDLEALGLICTGKLGPDYCLMREDELTDEERKEKDVWLRPEAVKLMRDAGIVTVGQVAALVTNGA